MSTILHVLNGDSTAYSFEETGLDGDTLIWREVLSQGPVMEDISSGAFWTARSAWICGNLDETPENYLERVVNPLAKLSEPYEEITLWFEFDLHCQINLLGVITMLNKKTDLSSPSIYLVCPDDVDGVEHFIGMGQLNNDQLEDLYDTRVTLTDWDFTLASEAWKLYVSGDADTLEKWIEENTFWGNMHLLKAALQAHLARVRTNEAGLNAIEQKLLDIFNSGITAKPEIYQAFWQTEKIYGMGDLEIDIYLHRMAAKQLITW